MTQPQLVYPFLSLMNSSLFVYHTRFAKLWWHLVAMITGYDVKISEEALGLDLQHVKCLLSLDMFLP